MSFSVSTTTTSSPLSSASLLPLSVSVMAVHIGGKHRDRLHWRLHEVKCISVTSTSSDENLTESHFEVTIFTKTTLTLAGPHDPVHRSEKQLADFEALRAAICRAVDVTHFLSRCSFCKAIKAHCAKELNSSLEGREDRTHLALEQFMNDNLALLVPLRRSSDKRVCCGKLQCWHLLSQFLRHRSSNRTDCMDNSPALHCKKVLESVTLAMDLREPGLYECWSVAGAGHRNLILRRIRPIGCQSCHLTVRFMVDDDLNPSFTRRLWLTSELAPSGS
ncbi:hypothetical protein JG688_00007377 [Phytophthora aleatoria]|uniref:Uncharacterized protein n=1 Tax=Phytophthora aleatoria TaxID=2496075 RepID=A0A8J5M846_9STRA|nr:hypothetical protein JG688_00007377 [Phytophthora aleatoria]